MKKVIVMFHGSEEKREEIEAICGERAEAVILPHDADRETFERAVRGADALLGAVPPEWLEGTGLKWVHLPIAGANRIAGKPGVRDKILTNSSGAFGATIAEHSLSLLLAFARHLPEYLRQGARGEWKDCGCEWGLAGRRALVLGTGDLGTQLALRLKALGLRVTGVCRTDDRPREPYERIFRSDRLDELLPEADVVFGCLPSTRSTTGLLDGRRLSLMREGAILINVGRGDLIDTDALVGLLRQGKFTGVGLDVTDPEPLPPDHPLWSFDNVIVTPHVSGIGFGHLGQTQSDVWSIALDNLRRWCAEEPLNNIVDQEQGY